MVETTQISTSWWMGQQNVVCPYTGILFSHKKGWKIIPIHAFPLLGVCSRLEYIRRPKYLIHVFIAAEFKTDPNLERTKCHQQETGGLSCRVFLWQGATQPREGNDPPAGATWMNHIFTVCTKKPDAREYLLYHAVGMEVKNRQNYPRW